MNKYSEVLKSSITESGLKLDKISEMVESLIGTKPTKQYLSRLQNAKTSPASDRMNDALAQILNIDPIDLKTAAYREKIPKEVLERLTAKTA